jgi:hypothetical protein
LMGSNSMGSCENKGCEKIGFLYPRACSHCSGLTAEIFQIGSGQSITMSNGTIIEGANPYTLIMLANDKVYVEGTMGNITVTGHLVIGIP